MQKKNKTTNSIPKNILQKAGRDTEATLTEMSSFTNFIEDANSVIFKVEATRLNYTKTKKVNTLFKLIITSHPKKSEVSKTYYFNINHTWSDKDDIGARKKAGYDLSAMLNALGLDSSDYLKILKGGNVDEIEDYLGQAVGMQIVADCVQTLKDKKRYQNLDNITAMKS